MKIEVRRPYSFSQFELLQKEFVAFSHYHLTRFVGQLGFFLSHSQNTLEEVKSLNSEQPPTLPPRWPCKKPRCECGTGKKKNPKEED